MNPVVLAGVVILWMLVISWQATKVGAALVTKDQGTLVAVLLVLVVMIGLAVALGGMLTMWLRILLLVSAVGLGLWMGRRAAASQRAGAPRTNR